MIKSNLIVAAMALFLAACATSEKAAAPEPRPGSRSIDIAALEAELGFDSEVVKTPSNCTVNVFVNVYDEISIDHEPVSTRQCGGLKKEIKWRLNRSGVVYTFPEPGAISFKGTPLPTNLGCSAPTPGKVVTCTFDPSSSPARYQYSITVLKNGVALTPLDPYVFNN